MLHYDGTPITARFITRRHHGATAERRERAAPTHVGGRMTWIAKPKAASPDADQEQGRLHPARLRRQDLHAVRRLRARLDLGGHHPGLLGAGHRAAPRGQALGHRLLVQDADYFLGRQPRLQHRARAHAQVLTGANLANRDLLYLGVSGDGDSASIGLGQFAHAMRRGVRMVYIVENNGVYGLTKGQFSPPRRRGKSKKGVVNSDSPVDLVGPARCSWARPSWRAASRATRRSWCR